MPDKNNKIFKTSFSDYELIEKIGEGGSGIIYKVEDSKKEIYAIKLLHANNLSKEKLGRFKNEISFCQRNHHLNLISILDHGLYHDGNIEIPFFVMNCYDCSLRSLMIKGIDQNKILPLYSQILDGIEAAHLLNTIHRDLKPENILYDKNHNHLVITDFGIAQFLEEDLYTIVETKPDSRLANFLYAAPEQKMRNQLVDERTDIYSLGLLLNEMFTGNIPQGEGYMTIGQKSQEYSYLDKLVSLMIQQNIELRPKSIDKVKELLIGYQNEFITRQKISDLEKIVIPVTDIDDPILKNPILLSHIDYQNGNLVLLLNQKVNEKWIWAFKNMGSHKYIPGKEPERFKFSGNQVSISLRDVNQSQMIVDLFKEWLLQTNKMYEILIRKEKQEEETKSRQELINKINEEKKKAEILRNVKI